MTRIISADDAQERLGKMLPEVVDDYTRIVASGGSGSERMAFETFKKKFMGSVLPKVPEELAKALFRAFDTHNTGAIDLDSFICGLAILRLGTAEERMRLIFNAYDRSRTGHLSKEDILHYATISAADSVLTRELKAEIKRAETLLSASGNSSKQTHFTFPQFTEWVSKQVGNADANVDVIVWVYEFEDLLQRKGIRSHHHDLLTDSYFPTQGSLVLQTGLSDSKVSDLTESFNGMQSSSTNGLLDKKAFCDSLPSISSDIKERLFHAVDTSQTGSLSRTELLNAVALCSEGTQHEKLLFCLKMFGKIKSEKKLDEAGFELDQKEFEEMINVLLTPQRLINEANGVKTEVEVPEEATRIIEHTDCSTMIGISQVSKSVREPIAAEFLSVLWTVVSLDLRIRPDRDEEESVISLLNSPQYHPTDYTGPAGTVWYLIDQKWWSEWRQSIVSLEPRSAVSPNGDRGTETWVGTRTLPQLTSQRLLDGYGYLHRNINWAGLLDSELTSPQKATNSEGANAFEVISPSAWKAIASWYGGSHSAIARTVIEICDHSELELHPPCIKVLQGSPFNDNSNVPTARLESSSVPSSEMAFSALNTLNMIVREASTLYGLDEKDAVLWEKSLTGLGRSTRWQRITDLSRTLLEADIADGNQFIICPVEDVKVILFESTDGKCSLTINLPTGALLRVDGVSTIVNSADILRTNSGTHIIKFNSTYVVKLIASGDVAQELVGDLHKLLELCGVDTVIPSDTNDTISLLAADLENLTCGIRVECHMSDSTSRKVKATVLSAQRQTVKVLPYHNSTAITIPKKSILRIISGKEDPVSLGRVGLQNLTNTCYMNSIVQVFSHTKPIRDYLMSGRFLSDLNRSAKHDTSSGGKITMSLSELV